MDKKTRTIIVVLGVVLLGLLCLAFFADWKDDTIITINDVKYSKKDYENYYKIRYFEELQSAKQNEGDSESENESKEINKEELKSTTLNEFATYVIIQKEASEKGFGLKEDTIKSIEEKYDAEDFDRETLNKLGVSKEDYIKTQKLVETYNNFTSTVDEYYDVPQSEIDKYFEDNKDTLKGYDFRIMYFNITSNESEENKTEENSETNQEDANTATTETENDNKPVTTNKDEVVAKAQGLLDRVKAGEDFEKLAKENADSRFVYADGQLNQVNGELESVDLPYLQSYLMFSCSNIQEPLTNLTNPGDYTELVTTDSYVAFARLEAVRNEVKEETMEAMKKSVTQSIASQNLSDLMQSASVIVNSKLLKEIEI